MRSQAKQRLFLRFIGYDCWYVAHLGYEDFELTLESKVHRGARLIMRAGSADSLLFVHCGTESFFIHCAALENYTF